jgi:molecular chaperone DnaK
MSITPDLVVGIDLGTTNSAIAAVIDGQITVIPVAGQPTMPSAVGLDPSGKLVVGQAAKNQSIAAPEATVLSVKRLMGTDDTVELGGKSYRPEEISALILSELRKAAEAHLDRPVTHAVITVPAFFNERQRQATQDAGRLAGLEVMRIINEPTAAALAYGAGKANANDRELTLVFDLGGGTFDVSLVSVENGIVEVKSSHGDTRLGGDDFDNLLVKASEKKLLGEQSTDALPIPIQRRLKAVMERAKICLSDEPFAAVREEYITETSHLDTELSRMDYEKLIEPLLEKTLDCLQRTLGDAGETASSIRKVLLVGGATRTPIVQEMLRHRLGREPHHEINPDLIVAMGAAIQGSAMAGHPAPAILIDITAHTYSINAIDELGGLFCAPIVRRGTPLPVKRSEPFTTSQDNQKIVHVEVYQGESPLPEDNLRIGDFKIEGLAPVPRGNLVVVTFQIDLDGLLTVTALEKNSGLAKSVTIDTAGQHRINLDAARANLAGIFNEVDMETEYEEDDFEFAGQDSPPEPAEARPDDLLASARSLRRRANALLETHASELSDTDSAGIRDELVAVSAAIRDRDWSALEAHLEKLSDLLFYLEE